MPRVSVVNVTASALKRPILTAVLVGFVVAAILCGLWYWRQQASCTLSLPQGCVGLETAITPQQQSLGLGKRAALATNKGMIFIYNKPQRTCFWMKDTQFNLDIIWLNQSKTITKIEPNLAPSSYPKTYCSANDTKYVIELNAGSVERNNLAVGQKLNF